MAIWLRLGTIVQGQPSKEPGNQLHPSQKTSKYVVHNRIRIRTSDRQRQKNRRVINDEGEPNEEFNSAGGIE